MQAAGFAVTHHVQRSGHREGRHRQAAGHGFQHHQAEGVGAAGKDEHVAGGEISRQFLAEAIADEVGLGKARLQLAARRAVADHQLAARQRQFQERRQVLFHRQAPGIHPQRARQMRRQLRLAILRAEQRDVDAASPARQVREAPLAQQALHVLGGHQRALRRAVEAAHQRVTQGQRHEGVAGMHVFRKLRVVGGVEGQRALQAIAARRPAQRAFRGDVDMVGVQRVEQASQPAIRQQCQADFRIAGQSHAAKTLRADDLHLMPHGAQGLTGAAQRGDHAIDLGLPGIGADDDLHGRHWAPLALSPRDRCVTFR